MSERAETFVFWALMSGALFGCVGVSVAVKWLGIAAPVGVALAIAWTVAYLLACFRLDFRA